MTNLKMNKFLSIKLFLFCLSASIMISCVTKKNYVTQNEQFNVGKFQFDKIDVNEIEEIEQANNGIIKDTVEFELSLNNFKTNNQTKTKTFIYKRLKDEFSPKLHVWYHVDETSEELVAITYNWDFYNPSFDPDKNEDLLIETNKRENEYQNKYSELNKLLKGRFDNRTEVNLISDDDYSFNEMTYWEDEKLYAYSRIRFQRRIDKNPMIGLAGNHFVVQMVISFK